MVHPDTVTLPELLLFLLGLVVELLLGSLELLLDTLVYYLPDQLFLERLKVLDLRHFRLTLLAWLQRLNALLHLEVGLSVHLVLQNLVQLLTETRKQVLNRRVLHQLPNQRLPENLRDALPLLQFHVNL